MELYWLCQACSVLRNFVPMCFMMSVASAATTRGPRLVPDCFILLNHRTMRRTLQDNVVSLAEGDSLTISCGACQMTRDDENDNSERVDTPYFSTDSLRRQQQGDYTFICPEGNRTITLHVFYSPEWEDIERQVTTEQDSSVHFTEHAESNSLPDDSPEWRAISRPVTNEQDSSVHPLCHAESKPPPSDGTPIIASVDREPENTFPVAAAIMGWCVVFVVVAISVFLHLRKRAAFKKYKRFAEPSIRQAAMSSKYPHIANRQHRNEDLRESSFCTHIPGHQDERDRTPVYDLCEHL